MVSPFCVVILPTKKICPDAMHSLYRNLPGTLRKSVANNDWRNNYWPIFDNVPLHIHTSIVKDIRISPGNDNRWGCWELFISPCWSPCSWIPSVQHGTFSSRAQKSETNGGAYRIERRILTGADRCSKLNDYEEIKEFIHSLQLKVEWSAPIPANLFP